MGLGSTLEHCLQLTWKSTLFSTSYQTEDRADTRPSAAYPPTHHHHDHHHYDHHHYDCHNHNCTYHSPPTTSNRGIGSIVELSKGNRNRRHLLSMSETSSDPLWSMVVAAEKALRLAKPDAEPCWLCFDPHPPYYEAVGMNGTYVIKNENNPTQCRWDSSQAFQGGLRMDVIQGRGKCVGPVSKEKQKLCDNIESKLNTEGWAVPNSGIWWMCSKAGLTPCISVSVLSSSNEFCMQVIIVPKAKYWNLTDLYDYHKPNELPRAKREAITAISVATLVGLGMAGVGTGIAALTVQNQGLSSLKAAVLIRGPHGSKDSNYKFRAITLFLGRSSPAE